jgi:hypothetical protein
VGSTYRHGSRVGAGERGVGVKNKCKEFQVGDQRLYRPDQDNGERGDHGIGPYEVRGPWSLRLNDDGTKADFSAALNMGFSDGWEAPTPITLPS